MTKLKIFNGIVVDPLNNIQGEVKDILIEDGKIVEKFSSQEDVKEIDAAHKTVVPAALDIHTHIASQQATWARLLGNQNDLFKKAWKYFTLEEISKSYISNGYTTVLEANVYPSLVKETVFDFKHLPLLDKAFLLNVSNLWPLESEFQKKRFEDAAVFISDLLQKTKGFGLKAYNPFEAEEWNFKELRENIEEKGKLYNFSAMDVYETLIKANEYLKLPHAVHTHIEGYETEVGNQNLNRLLEIVKSKDSSKTSNRTSIFHLAHASSYFPDGNISSFLELINNTDKIDLDLGFLTFNEINPVISSDRRFINTVLQNNIPPSEYKILRSAMEFEGDFFVSLRKFEKGNKSHSIYWLNALNLALNIKDKWKVQLTLNYPNYGNIKDIPQIATWLLSKHARNEFYNSLSLEDGLLDPATEPLSFSDFIIISRASPAKSIGLNQIKGHLGAGADGDVNILDLNINETDLSNDPEKVYKSFKELDHVIKEGNIVKKGDQVDLSQKGKILWSEGSIDKSTKVMFLNRKAEFYKKYYSIFYDSLNVSIEPGLLRKID